MSGPLSNDKADSKDKKQNLALLVIDAQWFVCSPSILMGNERTETVSRRIARLLPEFRRTNISIYIVYLSPFLAYLRNLSGLHRNHFYKFTSLPTDIPVAKWQNSAFAGSNISSLLRRNGHNRILVCGFNLSACVQETARDAVKEGYEVTVLEDLTANNNANPYSTDFALRDMKQQNIAVKKSQDFLLN